MLVSFGWAGSLLLGCGGSFFGLSVPVRRGCGIPRQAD
jgi:hypothetical protein